jgi:hypothetical protein
MPQGDKSSYTNKQKRKAGHIEEGYRKRGVSKGEAEERAWRTVNKQDGGAKKTSTSSRRKSTRSSSRNSSGARKRSTGGKRTTAKLS